ncbi:glycosyl hydrolase [Cryomorphaceae bacterium 1068]|nr:glycosyl hydrolase [Cryomorphaceae bacterium 1068]
MKKALPLILGLFLAIGVSAQKKDKSEEEKPRYEASAYSGLKFRNIGPALTSGRIADIAVNPDKPHEFYLAIASGGIWKTINNGTTFEPIFDGEGSYSTGCITMAPSNSSVVWVGSGENNNQRSVAYGDGVYKSTDGGFSWKNMGLKESEHIGMIAIHPDDENTVYVAAYGPLWSAGGERGIYKTTDGGENWELILEVSEHTGFNEIHMDPRDPDLLYATAHQRRRHVFTYIDGGPESAIYKSTDGGANWKKLESGLPKNDMGRIGMDISPANPDVVYAIIKATDNGGFYRSMDRGESWKKMSDYQTSGNYYQEIVCHPYDVDIIYSMSTWLHHTEDGGKTFKETGEKYKHVDNHCMWIDPDQPDHWRVGCDGGLYETWNAAEDWLYYPNLPITQFYKVAVDNAEPFYNVYGGTQDNNTQGGPSRTTSQHGIMNSDWFITNGGDGFEPAIDPTNPDIVYGQAQYGWLVRYDKKSGERVAIQPQPGKDEAAYRWNWDAPLLISPHNPKRLYFAANKVFKSEDRGDSWETISPDLTQQLDRNTFKVMDKVWGPDAVMKNKSTSIYGNIVAFDESPIKEGLLYAGTDDGLIQISEDGGDTWTKVASVSGVPDRTYVNMLKASLYDENVVYAVFNNHKEGDFKPYVYRSDNRGKSWTSITSNLPERGSTYAIIQDHVDEDLLFVGTEFGVFFTNDGGANWLQIKGGIPTIAARDLEIQRRENDLVVASFGRSFYVLDDYTPLRDLSDEVVAKDAHIYPIKDALLYVKDNRMGGRGKGSQGGMLFISENPDFGATITYYLGEEIKTLEDQRKEKEKELRNENLDEAYPSLDELRKEDREEAPYLLFVIKDSSGEPIRKMRESVSKGMHRLTWNLRHTTTSPIKLKTGKLGRYSSPDEGMLALPGTYTVEMYKNINGEFTQIHEPVAFEVTPLDRQTLMAQDREEVLAFQEKVAELQRSISGTNKLYGENKEKLEYIEKAVEMYPAVPMAMMDEIRQLEDELYEIRLAIYGDQTRSSRDIETEPSLNGRVGYAAYSSWWNTAEPTKTAKEQITIAEEEYVEILEKMRGVASSVEAMEKRLVEMKVPYTPGRGSDWGEE